MNKPFVYTPTGKFSRSIFLVGWILIAVFSCVIVLGTARDIKTSEASNDSINLSANAASDTQINLFWSAPSNAATIFYTIYRDGNKIHTTPLTNYQDIWLTQNTTYSYTVTAYDSAADKYWQSSASATTDFSNAQVSINSYSVTSKSANSATIKWETNIPAIGTVNYGPNSLNLTRRKTDYSVSTSHSVILEDLKPNTKYYYRIKALGGTTSAQTRLLNFRTTP